MKEPELEDLYAILEIPKTATTTEIKKAYRKLALQCHPDRQETQEERERCNDIFARLAAAYEILSDEEQRKEYDRKVERKNNPPAKKKPAGGANSSTWTKYSASDNASRTSKASQPAKTSSTTSSKTGATKVPTSPAKQQKSTPFSSNSTSKPTPWKGKSTNAKTSSLTPNSPKKATSTHTTASSYAPTSPKKQSKQINENANWSNPLDSTGVGGPSKGEPSSLQGQKFHDPFEVFKNVFKEEFGEDFDPKGKKTLGATPAPTKKQSDKSTSFNNNKHSNKKQSQNDKGDDDNRALAGKMTTKQVLHDDGRIETITTTIITRPNGETERIVKSSFDKDHKTKNKNAAITTTSSKTAQPLSSPTRASPKKHAPNSESSPKKHPPKVPALGKKVSHTEKAEGKPKQGGLFGFFRKQ